MSAFYSKMQRTATKLLTKFGKPQHIQYTFTVGATEDEDFGGTVGGTPTTENLIGVVTKVSDSLLGSMVDGKTIISSDRVVIVDSRVKPEKPGQLKIAGEPWNIIGLTDIDPAGQPIVYKVVCRGA